MKDFNNMTLNEQNEVSELLANWLKNYTKEVIMKVMQKRNEIINDEHTMHLIKELKVREEKENKDFIWSINNLLFDYEKYKEHNPHNHPLEHAGSYRDILYDMYIKEL